MQFGLEEAVLIGIDCGHPVDIQWSVNTQLVLEAQDGVAWGVAWPLPASGPLTTLNNHF